MKIRVPISFELQSNSPERETIRFREWLTVDITEVAPEAAPCVLKTGFGESSSAYHKVGDAFWLDQMGTANAKTSADVENHRLPDTAAFVFGYGTVRAMDREGEHAFNPQTFDAISLEPRVEAIRCAQEKAKNLIVVDDRILAREKSEPVLVFVRGIDDNFQDVVSGVVGDPLEYTGDGIVQIFSVNTDEARIHEILEEQGWDLAGKTEDQKGINWVEVINPDAFTENVDLRNFTTNIRNGLQEIGWSVSIEAEKGNEEARGIRALTQKALLVDDESPDVADQLETAALELSTILKGCRSHAICRNDRLNDAVDLMQKAILRWTNDKIGSLAPAM